MSDIRDQAIVLVKKLNKHVSTFVGGAALDFDDAVDIVEQFLSQFHAPELSESDREFLFKQKHWCAQARMNGFTPEKYTLLDDLERLIALAEGKR